MSIHEPFEELCALSLTGELNDDEVRMLADHLDECSSCRACYRDFESMFSTGLPSLESHRSPRRPYLGIGLKKRFAARARSEGIPLDLRNEPQWITAPGSVEGVFGPPSVAAMMPGVRRWTLATSGYIAALMLGAALLLSFLVRLELTVDADFNLRANEQGVYAQTGGWISELYVKEGQRVREGDKLAVLSSVAAGNDLHLHTTNGGQFVIAPIEGVLDTPLERKRNEFLAPGTELARILDVTALSAEMLVPEWDVIDIKPENVVDFRVVGLPDEDFHGRVTFISTEVQKVEGRSMVVVRAELLNQDGRLKPNSTGHAKIHSGKRRIIDLLTRRMRLRTKFLDLIP